MSLPAKTYTLSSPHLCESCKLPIESLLFAKRGKVLAGASKLYKSRFVLTSVNPKAIYSEEEVMVPIVKYTSGLICVGCQANYRTDHRGNPLIKLDKGEGGEVIAGHGIGADKFGLKQVPPLKLRSAPQNPEHRSCGRCGRAREVHGVNGECPRSADKRIRRKSMKF